MKEKLSLEAYWIPLYADVIIIIIGNEMSIERKADLSSCRKEEREMESDLNNL